MIINIKSRRAFTLLEISIVILIVGILLVGTINFQLTIDKKSKENITNDRIAEIERAINGYILEKGKLPCPASINLSKNDSNYGKEMRDKNNSRECVGYSADFVHNGLIYGSVPTKTLGLTDDYAVDGWNNTISYVISKKYGDEKIFLADNTKTITMENVDGKEITSDAIYVIISSGKNKNGAFKDGTQLSEPNSSLSDAQNAFSKNFSGTFKKDIQTDNFDDIVAFKDKDIIIMKENMQLAVPCSLKDLSDFGNDWTYDTYSGCNNGLCPQGKIVVSNGSYPDNKVSKNPSNVGTLRKPIRECLRYGKWSDVMYPYIDSCDESNIDDIETNELEAGELRYAINLNYLKRAKLGETIKLECIGDKYGYIVLTCQSDGNWIHNSGDCYDKVPTNKACRNSELNANDKNFYFSITTGKTESPNSVEGTCVDGYFAQPDISVIATCQVDGTWSYTGSCLTVCDLNDLRSDPNDNTNEAVAISAKAPGVPGSKFRQDFFLKNSSFTGNIKSGEVYDKRYFTSGTVLDATCFNDNTHGYYTETALDGQVTISEFGGLHAYKCLNGEWKRGGNCISDCSNADLEYTHIASFNVGTDPTTDYNKIRIGTYENGYSGPIIAAICKKNDEGPVWTYKKVCDKYTLKANNDNMDRHVISVAPGVPGSMFILPDGKGFDSVNLSTDINHYEGAEIYDYGNDKKRYFTDGALLEAKCDTGYTEVAINGEVQITNNWGKHLYKCEEGVWKRAGNCAPDCDNSVLSYPATTFSNQNGITVYNETQIGSRDGANGPVIATCQADGTWNYEGVCDLEDLKAGGETIAISTKSPGVPGSKFREGFFNNDGTFKKNYVDGTFYSNRYFANGAKVDAACYDSNVNYVEVPFGSPYSDFELPSTVPSGQKKFYPHAYECQNGQWKRAGGCFDKRLGCIGNPTISSQILQLSSDTNNNTSTLGLYQNKNYYELNSIINTTCAAGYSEICQDSNSEASCYANTKNGSVKLNTWLQCENGSWVQHGSCSVTTCSNAELANVSNTTFGSITGTTDYNGTQIGTCNTGYTGTITVTCQANGTWSYEGTCAESSCTPSNVPNGYWVYANNDIVDNTVSHGITITKKCNTGYYLDGTVSWTCDKGNWVLQNSTGTCTSNENCACIKSCDSDNILLVAGSQKIDNDNNKLQLISGTLFKNNGVQDAECSSGYQETCSNNSCYVPDTSNDWQHFYRCENGSWVTYGSCFYGCKGDPTISSPYTKSENIYNITPIAINNVNYYDNGGVIDTGCVEGYSEVCDDDCYASTSNGGGSRKWNTWLQCENGKWAQKGECKKKCSNSSLTFTNATFSSTTGTTNYNGTQTGTCNTGYSGSITATCGENGTWSYSGSCTNENVCDKNELSLVANSYLSPSNEDSQPLSGTLYANGALLDATCNSGYVESANNGDIQDTWGSYSHAYKCVNGQWKTIGSCAPVNCSSEQILQEMENNHMILECYGNFCQFSACKSGYIQVGSGANYACQSGNFVKTNGDVLCVTSDEYNDYINFCNINNIYDKLGDTMNLTRNGTEYVINGSMHNSSSYTNGTMIDAHCNSPSQYDEVATGGEITNEWDKLLAFKCVNGEWKRMGSCVKKCENSTLSLANTYFVTAGTTSVNGTQTGTCNSGYSSNSGSNITATCQANGTWSYTGSCVQNCHYNGGKTNGYWADTNGNALPGGESGGTVPYGTRIQAKCDSGYTLSGSSITECRRGDTETDGNGWKWEINTASCVINTCSNSNLSYSNATFTTSGTTNYNQTQIGTCNSGYYPTSGSGITATCQADGTWSYSDSCVRVCDKNALRSSGDNIISTAPGVLGSKFWRSYDEAVTNTSIYGGNVYEGRYFTNGALIEASCDTGYTEVATGGQVQITNDWGKHLYKCENGTWKRAGNCSINTCSNSNLSYSNATFTTSGTTNYNQTQIGTCNSGYYPTSGSGITATCQADGTWSYSGTCVQGCENDPTISSPYVKQNTSGNSTPAVTINGVNYYSNNAVIDTGCIDGYSEVCPSTSCNTPSGGNGWNTWIQCENGKWAQKGECKKKCSNSSLTFTNATFSSTTGTTNYKGTQTGTCNTGYTGSITATCGENGTWSYNGSCSPKSCIVPNNRDNAKWYEDDTTKSAGSSVSHGKTIVMKCNSPFINLGSTSATCSYGNWQWNSDTGECGCAAGNYVSINGNYYIKHCSNSSSSASVRCDIDSNERYGAMKIGHTSRTSSRGTYKNITGLPAGYSNDTGLCYIKVICGNNGVVSPVKDEPFSKNNFNDAPGWDASSDCNYDRSNSYMNAVCCNN